MKTTKLFCLITITTGLILATSRAQEEEAPPEPAAAPPVSMPAEGKRESTVSPSSLTIPKGNESVGVIDFQGTPLSAVLEYYARLTQRSIIQAPNLAGTIYFRSQTNLTKSEAIQALDSVLALNGIGIVPLGEKFLKVVQIGTAKQEGIGVGTVENAAPPAADTLVSRIIALKYAEISDVVGALQPYVHAYGNIIPLAKANSILITDTGGNVNQMLEIVKYIDQPSPLRMQTKVYTIARAKAADVMARLQAIITETQQLGSWPAAPTPAPAPVPTPVPPRLPARTGSPDETVVEGKVVLTADERTNKLFVLSRPSNFTFFDQLIAELDAKVDPDIVMRVIELSYANAEDAASLVNTLISGGTPTTTRRTTSGSGSGTSSRSSLSPAVPAAPASGTGAAALEAAGFLQFSAGVRVLPDPRTNSLLVMATKDDMERLDKLIKSVDTAVAQVLVEVVIAEVKLDDSHETGVNLLNRVLSSDKGRIRTYGGMTTMADSGGGAAPAPVNLFDPSVAIGAAGPMGAAVSSALTYFATFKGLKLDMAIRLLAASGKFKVLSTPIIQTLHNQEASIIVGESRPIVTATLSDVTGTTSSTNLTSTALRSNVEYKDIAIELKVTPRINPDGYVTMEIDQKVNDLGGSVNVGGTQSPIITKREAKSFVTAKDQSTIVLGGLIREDRTASESKVPVAGDIPLFGLLFKNRAVAKSRTELIVFIRPTVLRSAEQTASEAERRGRMLKAADELGLQKYTTTNAVPPTAQERHDAKVRALTGAGKE
jgi:general secretion pathway protein D